MNGQMYQIAIIVAAAKIALQTGEQIKYNDLGYENSTKFSFLPKRGFFKTEKYQAKSVSDWFDRLKKNGLQDIKLLCPVTVKDRNLLGFSNTTESSMVCFYEEGKLTYFTPYWQFDSAIGKWNILYSEHEWPNPPAGKPRFKDNSDSFRQILSDIRDFASRIENKIFADVFATAIGIIDGVSNDSDLNLPSMPERNLRLFAAANLADVFGAMGSWNDEPAAMAQQKGLSKEYDRLSDELLRNVRLAILYAVNEL